MKLEKRGRNLASGEGKKNFERETGIAREIKRKRDCEEGMDKREREGNVRGHVISCERE